MWIKLGKECMVFVKLCLFLNKNFITGENVEYLFFENFFDLYCVIYIYVWVCKVIFFICSLYYKSYFVIFIILI